MRAPLLVLCAFLPPSSAGEGSLDRSFAGSGAAITDLGQNDYAMGVAIQPDGGIVVAGRTGDTTYHSALVRYTSDGSLDQAFGDHGRVVAVLGPYGDQLNAVALQSDGRIVAAGSLVDDSARLVYLVARFHEDGSPDPSFGTLGAVTTGFGDQIASASAVLVQPDGKIVVVGSTGAGGYSELNDFALARYDPDGSLDQGFGGDGRVVTHFFGWDNTGSRATGVALQPDGKLIVAGAYKNEAMPRELALARYLPDGTLDGTFRDHGRVTTSLGAAEALPGGIVVQRDGKIVLGGSFTTGRRNHDFALVRYEANGELDPGFGDGGRIVQDLFDATDDVVYDVSLQRDGKLVLVGQTGQYPNLELGLARYLPNGELDPGFGAAGRVRTSLGGFSSQAISSALQLDGKVVVAGNSFNATADLVVARYVAGAGPRARMR